VLVVVATAVAMVATAGLQFWVAREVARSQDVRGVGAVLARHTIAVLVLVPIACLAIAPLLAVLVDANVGAIVATAVLAATAAINLMVLAVPNGARAMGVVATATAAAGVLYLIGTGLLLTADRASIVLVLVIAAIANALSTVIALVYTRTARVGPGPGVPTRDTYRDALAFGIPGGLAELVLIAMLRVDVLLVAAFLPLRDVGLYVVAVALTELLWVVPDGVAQVVLPTTARHPRAARTRQLLRGALGVTAFGGIVLSLGAGPLIATVFGAAYEGAAAAVPLLAVASLAGGAWKIIGADVVARGRTTPRLTSAIAGLIVMVGVDLVAIPTLGIAGAALGSAAGYAAASACIARSWIVSGRDIVAPHRLVAGETVG